MIKIVLIDNYDSFTYNLVHYFETLGANVTVYRNDEFVLEGLESFQNIVLSPGPGLPNEAGLLKDVIRKYASTKNILGICLGLQAIVEVFGGTLKNLPQVYHGVSSKIKITDFPEPMFYNLPEPIEVGRYHSWAANIESIPNNLAITAFDEENNIMAIRHQVYEVAGLQFHPESILTPSGLIMLKQWLESISD
uniref:anthranilate synthase component II n=1 Tax=Flavobacterium sp. TaxID=239 RepID=UPI004049F199